MSGLPQAFDMPGRASRGAIIALAGPGHTARKLVRLVFLRDGSFTVSSPYHPIKTGVVAKLRMGIHVGVGIARGHVEEAYRVDAPVKLSVHRSGFVQFSTAGPRQIRSGETQPFSLPKGLGLHTLPLAQPIETGPTWAATFYDPSTCAELHSSGESAQVLVFAETDMFERDEHDFASSHVYQVEGFMFPAERRREAVFWRGKGWILDSPYSPLRPEWPVRFRVLDLPTPLVFMGILISRRHMPPGAHVGYMLSSPRDLTQQFALTANYPASEWGSTDEIDSLPTITFEPATERERNS